MAETAIFEAPNGIWRADTCEPLDAAWRRGDVVLEAFARGSYPGVALPDDALPGLKTVGYWDAPRDQVWGLDWHRNEGIEITCLARGSLGFSTGRDEWRLRGGDVTITRPWQRHRVGNPTVDACRLHWLMIDVGVRRPHQLWHWPSWIVLSEPDMARLTTLLRHCEQPVWRRGAAVGRAFASIGELVRSGPPDASHESRLRLLINEVLVELLSLLERRVVVLDDHLSTVQRTVEHFLAEELPAQVELDWDLATMAAHCGLGRTRFAHYVHQIVNMSAIRYLTECRVQRGQALLAGSVDMGITDIAYACGFGSGQYFATVFRERTGETPQQFRRRVVGMRERDDSPAGCGPTLARRSAASGRISAS